MVTAKEEVAHVAKNEANSGDRGKAAAGGRRFKRDTGH
jgi:hypothetical protein